MVDLPAPDGPTRAVRLPRGAAKLDAVQHAAVRCGCRVRPTPMPGRSLGLGHDVVAAERLDATRRSRRAGAGRAAAGSVRLAPAPTRVRVGEVHAGELDRRRIRCERLRSRRRPSCASGAISRSNWSSVGRSMISWMRPSAPSAEFTAVTAPNAWPSGRIIMNRNRMNATRFATVMAPLATRKPPTPSTTRNDTCIAMPATGTTSAEIFATWMPIFQAPVASLSIAAISRSVAFDGADGAHRADRPLDRGGEVADLVLRLLAGHPDAPGQQRHDDDRHRDDEHGQPEQHRVDDEHRDQGADEGERAADRLDEPLGQHGAQQRGVGADARDEVAGAAGVELADRKAQHPPDQPAARREHDALAGALQQVVLVAGDQAGDDDQDDEEPDERRRAAAACRRRRSPG